MKKILTFLVPLTLLLACFEDPAIHEIQSDGNQQLPNSPSTMPFGGPGQLASPQVWTGVPHPFEIPISWFQVPEATHYKVLLASNQAFDQLIENVMLPKHSAFDEMTYTFQGLTINTTYYLRVFAVKLNGNNPIDILAISPIETPLPVSTHSGVVQFLPPSNISNTGFTVNWQSIPEATSYSFTLVRPHGPATSGTTTNPTKTFTSLLGCVDYTVNIRARIAGSFQGPGSTNVETAESTFSDTYWPFQGAASRTNTSVTYKFNRRLALNDDIGQITVRLLDPDFPGTFDQNYEVLVPPSSSSGTFEHVFNGLQQNHRYRLAMVKICDQNVEIQSSRSIYTKPNQPVITSVDIVNNQLEVSIDWRRASGTPVRVDRLWFFINGTIAQKNFSIPKYEYPLIGTRHVGNWPSGTVLSGKIRLTNYEAGEEHYFTENFSIVVP